MVDVQQTTKISERLHDEALAWFYQHPEHTAFLRTYVPGEFQTQQEQEFRRGLGAIPRFVQVNLFQIPVTTRMLLTQEMYDSMKGKRPPFFEAIEYTDRPILQEWLFVYRGTQECDICHKMPATWMFYTYEDIRFGIMLYQAGVKHKHVDECMWVNTMLEQITKGPQQHGTHHSCQRCIIETTNSIMGHLGATQIIPTLQKAAQVQDITIAIYRKMNDSDHPLLGSIKGAKDVSTLLEILSRPPDTSMLYQRPT